jgi:FAD/FMN-containing dehydrogenase
MTIIDPLIELLGPGNLLCSAADMDGFLKDERDLYQGTAACVALPGSTREVASVVQLCRQEGYAVVPQGGNTGYCGGASPDSDKQVLINLSRMNGVREIDTIGFTATVEAGVILAELHAAVAAKELFFPLSMGSQGSCQVGGVVSTNAGGLAVLKYGTAGELVLGLEVVLPSGEILDCLSPLRKDNTGYDLKSLFLGAEGTLGIVTAAVLKLFPLPTEHQTAWLALNSVEAVCQLLGLARKLSGDTVTSFEYISEPALRIAATHIEALRIPFSTPHPHQVLVELSGPQPAGALRPVLEALLEQAMAMGLVTDAVVADSESQRRQLWRVRETIPEAEKRAGRSIKHDVSVAISRIPEYLATIPAQLEAICDHRPSVYGHIGDGNLHYNVLAPADQDPVLFRQQHAGEISAAVHTLAVDMNGSFSAEHGIGKLKKPDLARFKDATSLQLMRDLKRTLDPDGMMNPGKVI